MYILLYLFWILLNGKITIEICLIGLLITIFMALILDKLFGYTPKNEIKNIKKAPLLILYIFILIWEIVKAAVIVSRDVIFKKFKVSPTLVTFETSLETEFGRFLLANSITLTPGTITVKIDGNKLTVHCLDKSMLDTSNSSTFVKWISRLEK